MPKSKRKMEREPITLSTLPPELFTQIITNLATVSPLTLFTSQRTSRRFHSTINHLVQAHPVTLFSETPRGLLQPQDPVIIPRDEFDRPLITEPSGRSANWKRIQEERRMKRTKKQKSWWTQLKGQDGKDESTGTEQGRRGSHTKHPISVRALFGFLIDSADVLRVLGGGMSEVTRHPLNVQIDQCDYFRCMPWALDATVRDRYTRAEASWRGIPVFSHLGEEWVYEEAEKGGQGAEEEVELEGRGMLGQLSGKLGRRLAGMQRAGRMGDSSSHGGDAAGRLLTSQPRGVPNKGVQGTAIRYIDVLQITTVYLESSTTYWGRIDGSGVKVSIDANEEGHGDAIESPIVTLGTLWDLVLWERFPSFYRWELFPGHAFDPEGCRWKASEGNSYQRLEENPRVATLRIYKAFSCVEGSARTFDGRRRSKEMGMWEPEAFERGSDDIRLGEPRLV